MTQPFVLAPFIGPLLPEEPMECAACEGHGTTPGDEANCSVCDGSGVVCPMCKAPARFHFGSAAVWGDDMTWPTCTECEWQGTP